jgi:hypothetical protein
MPAPAPGLYPRSGPRPGAPHGERAFWQALSQRLPAGWHAWHSLRIRTARGVEAEADFVLAVPGRGLLVIEVKGGLVEVDGGIWLQNGRQMPRAPREQAHEFRRTLGVVLREHDLHRVWIDVATAFPDTPFFEPPTQGDLRDAVLGQRDLEYLGDALESLRARLFVAPTGERAEAPTDDRWLKVLHALWGDSWVKGARLGAQRALRDDELVRLAAPQQQLLAGLAFNRRMLVRGGPGTGKTLLAMEAARRDTRAGRRVKLLCFTRALATALTSAGFDARTVRELAADVLTEAGSAPLGPREAWNSTIWDRVTTDATACLPAGGRDDADMWILDEAQDLSLEDWRFVRALAGERRLWVFLDDGQAYWDDRVQLDAEREGFASYMLTEGYRTPEGLERYSAQYRAGASTPWMSARIGGLSLVAVESEDDLPAAIEAQVARALREGLAPNEIAALSIGGQTKTRLGTAEQIGDRPARRADAPDATKHLVSDTFLRFKGLERPFVIVSELSLGPRQYDVRMHIALTRATMQCVVVATYGEIVADERLQALAASMPA